MGKDERMNATERSKIKRMIADGEPEALERYYITHVLPHDKRSINEILSEGKDADARRQQGG